MSWQTRGPPSAATRRASWAPRGRGGRWPTWSPPSSVGHPDARACVAAQRWLTWSVVGVLLERRSGSGLVQAPERRRAGCTRRGERRASGCAPPAAGVVARGRLRVPARGRALAAGLPAAGVPGHGAGRACCSRRALADDRRHDGARLARRPGRRGLARASLVGRGSRCVGGGVRRHAGRGGPGRAGPAAARPARGRSWRRPSPTCAGRGWTWSTPSRPSAAGSSATCTTASSSGWSRSP